MLDDATRKALLIAHLRESVLYYRAKENGLDVPDDPPELLPELGIDMAALCARAVAALVEYNLNGAAGDLLNPGPEAREIAAEAVRRRLDGEHLTPESTRLTGWFRGGL